MGLTFISLLEDFSFLSSTRIFLLFSLYISLRVLVQFTLPFLLFVATLELATSFLIACKRPLGITQNATQSVSSSPHEAVLMVHLGEKEKGRDRGKKQ